MVFFLNLNYLLSSHNIQAIQDTLIIIIVIRVAKIIRNLTEIHILKRLTFLRRGLRQKNRRRSSSKHKTQNNAIRLHHRYSRHFVYRRTSAYEIGPT